MRIAGSSPVARSITTKGFEGYVSCLSISIKPQNRPQIDNDFPEQIVSMFLHILWKSDIGKSHYMSNSLFGIQ